MKINQKIYDRVTTTPFDTQNLENGSVVELHSLNANLDLYNEYAPKAKFAIWSSKDGKNYRLLLEDGYYEKLRELYGKRVNNCWVDFWNKVAVDRKKTMLTIFLPLVLVIAVAFILAGVLKKQLGDNGQLIMLSIALVVFIIGNVFVNKRIDKSINKHNAEAIDDIKHIIGKDRFDALIDEQKLYYDEFFGLQEDNKTNEEGTPEEKQEEVSTVVEPDNKEEEKEEK